MISQVSFSAVLCSKRVETVTQTHHLVNLFIKQRDKKKLGFFIVYKVPRCFLMYHLLKIF
jgi:hypothetical protein